jgi:hypothetical protein
MYFAPMTNTQGGVHYGQQDVPISWGGILKQLIYHALVEFTMPPWEQTLPFILVIAGFIFNWLFLIVFYHR